ncbi:hypothetical protein [Paenibacillus arenilitoris]|uniref:Uncharacterized protein n=1 Tax=Paenibacillus arenilitoris TaxID=2772299 RepID=A0A927H6Z8_9BACL|nr:hypothetical protein [Paenibacillus arenilitoris]MBD2871081.1 hypothetical protein [Paenibacillus arenilitoris]
MDQNQKRENSDLIFSRHGRFGLPSLPVFEDSCFQTAEFLADSLCKLLDIHRAAKERFLVCQRRRSLLL